MRTVYTFCFYSCFLWAVGQDSLFLPRSNASFQDSGFIRSNTSESDFMNNNFTDYTSDPSDKITDNQIVSAAKNQFINPLTDAAKSIKKKLPFHAAASLQTQYVNNGYAPASTNGFYTTLRVMAQTSFLKIPLNGGVSLQMHGKQFRVDFTTANMNFDVNAYKGNLKAQYQDYIGDIKNYFGDGLGQVMEEYQDSVQKQEGCKATLSDPQYYNRQQALSSQAVIMKDSLEKDTANLELRERYTQVTDSLDYLDNVRSSYKTTTAYIKKYQQYSQMLDEYKGYVDKVKNTDDITKLPNAENELRKAGIATPKFNFLSGIQKMNIGRVGTEVSHYTFRQQTLYGLQLDYLTKQKIYIGGAFGWASQFNMQLTPSFFFNQQYRSFNPARLAGYLRGGYGGANENHIHVIWTGFGDKFNNTTPVFTEQNNAQANSVLAVEFLRHIGKAVTIKGEAATSNSSNSNRTSSIVPVRSKPPFNYALYTEITGNIQATKTMLSVRGEAVSKNFLSMTAPFLRNSMAGYAVSLQQPLLKGKINYAGMLQHNFQNYTDKSLFNSLISCSNNLDIQASPKASYQLFYGWFGNIPGKTSIVSAVSQSHTATLAQQYPYKIRKVRAVTVLTSSYSYSYTQMPEVRTKPLHNLQQGIQQQFVFEKPISWNIGAGGLYRTLPTDTGSNLGYWAETGNTFAIKKIANLKYQLKYLYDPVLLHQLNIMHTTDIVVYKGLRLNIGGTYNIFLIKQYTLANLINATAGIMYSW